MNPTLPNNLAVDRKLRTFLIESPNFLSRPEDRQGYSENQIRKDIERDEPWRLPVTIVEVE